MIKIYRETTIEKVTYLEFMSTSERKNIIQIEQLEDFAYVEYKGIDIEWDKLTLIEEQKYIINNSYDVNKI